MSVRLLCRVCSVCNDIYSTDAFSLAIDTDLPSTLPNENPASIISFPECLS